MIKRRSILMFTFTNYQAEYLAQMASIWNDVLKDGNAFPGEELFTQEAFEKYLMEQTIVRNLIIENEVAGFYVTHPNNIGRCSHVANTSYCMNKAFRGHGIFPHLVQDSLEQAQQAGFQGMQFNAVVASNKAAIHTYKKFDFAIVGTIPSGFRLKDGSYSDMYIMYKNL